MIYNNNNNNIYKIYKYNMKHIICRWGVISVSLVQGAWPLGAPKCLLFKVQSKLFQSTTGKRHHYVDKAIEMVT